MKLCEMAQEYRVNVALLELRIKQLQAAQKRARQPEVRYRLKQRAKFLQTLINESRQTVFLMEHYHEASNTGGESIIIYPNSLRACSKKRPILLEPSTSLGFGTL